MKFVKWDEKVGAGQVTLRRTLSGARPSNTPVSGTANPPSAQSCQSKSKELSGTILMTLLTSNAF